MLRILIIFYCFFTAFFSCKLNNVNGEVIYGFKPNFISKEEKSKSKELYQVLDNLNKLSKDVTFKLSFNEDESFFDINSSMDLDLKPGVSSYVKNAISKGKYYYNKKNDELYVESRFYDKYTLIKSKPSSIKWKIHKETKNIDSFLCTKATTIKIVKNRKGEKSFEIVAWFTPSIPANYGPMGFSGLPGLILELKSTSHTFYAKQVKLSDSFINIQSLNSKSIISIEEHNKNIDKLIENN